MGIFGIFKNLMDQTDKNLAAKHGVHFVDFLKRVNSRLKNLQSEIGHNYPEIDIVSLFFWSDITGAPKMGVDPTCPDDNLKQIILKIIEEENK